MQAPRLDDVLARVVAWHNRHPLARRIQASQVHSIGEVVLPFASAQPIVAESDAVDAPTETSVDQPAADDGAGPAPTFAAATADAADAVDLAIDIADGADTLRPAGSDTGELLIELPGETARSDIAVIPDAAAPDDDVAGAATLVQPRSPFADGNHPPAEFPDIESTAAESAPPTADGETGAELAGADPPPPTRLAPLAPLAERLQAARRKALADGDADADGAPPAPVLPGQMLRQMASDAEGAGTVPGATARPLRQRLAALARRVVRRLRGAGRPADPALRPTIRPAFSEDFIWPLSPRRVARWARRHGSAGPLAPGDWPCRLVERDPLLMQRHRQQGLPHAVTLHLLTAGIGVGDRRIRLLLDGDGAIVGPRAYDRRRVAAAAALVFGLALAAAPLWRTARPTAADSMLAMASAVATPAGDSASASARAASARSDAASASGADATDAAASVPGPAAAPELASARVAPDAADPPVQQPAPSIPSPTPTPTPTPSPSPSPASAPPAPRPTAIAADRSPRLGRIRPELSDAEREAARQQSRALRGGASPTAAAAAAEPVYALVTLAQADRAAAETGLAQMLSLRGRLLPPVPANGELLQSQGRWRAAWWPFATLADAERARVMLIGRGLKAEVVAF